MGSIYGEKFWELVEDIKAVGPSLRDENRQRYQRMLENPNVYNVVNHALWGLLDGAQAFWKSAVARSHAMLEDPSAFNIINYLTLGLGDVVKTAFDPSARLSEMLSAQVGVVTVAFGAYTAAGGTSVFKPSTLGKELSRNPKTYGYTKDAAAWADDAGSSFGSAEKLESHFAKHGEEFRGAYKNVQEYLQGANDVMENGYKIQYQYMDEARTGYVKFMETSSKGISKFEFVGTNTAGEITTYHVESGKSFWTMINGENVPVINPID